MQNEEMPRTKSKVLIKIERSIIALLFVSAIVLWAFLGYINKTLIMYDRMPVSFAYVLILLFSSLLLVIGYQSDESFLRFLIKTCFIIIAMLPQIWLGNLLANAAYVNMTDGSGSEGGAFCMIMIVFVSFIFTAIFMLFLKWNIKSDRTVLKNLFLTGAFFVASCLVALLSSEKDLRYYKSASDMKAPVITKQAMEIRTRG